MKFERIMDAYERLRKACPELDIPEPTEIEKKRDAWWAEHYKPGMSLDEVFKLNEELLGIYPQTKEEIEQDVKGWEGVPEFVL